MKSEKVSVSKQKAHLARYIRELKEKSPCRDCGKFFPYYVMDFDHVRGRKIQVRSSMAYMTLYNHYKQCSGQS